MRATGIVIGFVLIATMATASPYAPTWRRQTLVGENAEYFFRYVAIGENPASYYE